MTCKCGNVLGQPRVKPFPVSFVDAKTHQEIFILFNAGFIGDLCYFCAVRR